MTFEYAMNISRTGISPGRGKLPPDGRSSFFLRGRLLAGYAILSFSALFSIMSSHVLAQETRDLSHEYDKHINSATAVGFSDQLFGDRTNLFTGQTEFVATDVDVQGNNALLVQVGRRFNVSARSGLRAIGLFADWDIDIPHLHGIFASKPGIANGWQVTAQAAFRDNRCSVRELALPEPPPAAAAGPNSGFFGASEYWHGNSLYIPGRGGKEMLVVDTDSQIQRPDDGMVYHWVTEDNWYFSCLEETANGVAGEGFLAISPDGTRYHFNHIVKRRAVTLRKPLDLGPLANEVDAYAPNSAILPREEVWILPTLVEDRFANRVVYTYDTTNPWQLKNIASSDGRSIQISYVSGLVDTISADDRQWVYRYTGSGNNARLSEIILPDNSKWLFAMSSLVSAATQSTPVPTCVAPGDLISASYSGTITHPSGAIGKFTFAPQRHGRSYVEKICIRYNGVDYYSFYPQTYDVLALVAKKISGNGIADPLTWNYSYSQGGGSWAENCTTPTSCMRVRLVEVSEPDKYARYTFGTKWLDDEGKLLKTERGSSASSIYAIENLSYQLDSSLQVYPDNIGLSPNQRSDRTSQRLAPLKQRTISRQAVNFTFVVNTFDEFARPSEVKRSNTLGHSRTEATTYHDNLSKWIIGQVRTVACTSSVPASSACDGDIVSKIDYDANAMPSKTYSFGKLRHTLTYNTTTGPEDGTLKTVTDGRNYTTTLSSWKRGIPQTIKHPATSDQPTPVSQSAVVDNNGWIESVTDENGYTTRYDYDDMGRLSLIDYPDGDTPNWTSTTRNFSVQGAKYGLSNHWRLLETTGNGFKITRYDALWRPVIEETYDNADPENTRSLVVKRYDTSGRLAFQSYPLRTLGNYADPSLKGIDTEYDALDRVTAVRQDAENNTTLSTTTAYIAGFKTRVTSPKHQSANPAVYTETSYYAWDQPTTEFPKIIAHPESVQTAITRDAFGKPTAITRSGGGLSLTRQYVHNAAQELCKTIEPETGSTVMYYDAAGNLGWSAAGLALPSTTSCDDTHPSVAARKVSRTYDARNRLLDLQFPDGRGDQFWAYTPDGLPRRVHTVNVVGANNIDNAWEYTRGRRLLKTETQLLPAWYTYSLTYEYDGNGHLSKQWYPTGQSVEFTPNALGQATRVKGGTGHVYAHSAKYHPNGSLSGFTYGNGIAYSMTQNTRQLPARATHGVGVTDFAYTYDGNGNVASMTDHVNGNQSRTMAYDGLDRLKTVTSNMFGSTGANYDYNALDNLTRVRIGGANARDRFYCYDAANRLTNLKTGSCGGSTVTGLGYDLQGNVTNKNGELYDFDYGNRLREVMGVERYRYDAHGRRILANNLTTGTILSFYGHGGQLLYQKNIRTGQSKEIDHIHLAGSLIAQREQPIGGGTATVKYQHTDALGSPTEVTSSGGSVLERTEYEPFGAQLVAAASIGNDTPGYTGHVRDVATGLIQAQQRYYWPEGGVFLSTDEVTALSDPVGSFHRYRYADWNPYRFTDPDGRQARERFVERHRKDMEDGNGKVYEPFHKPAIAVTALMLGPIGVQFGRWAFTNPIAANNIAIGTIEGIGGTSLGVGTANLGLKGASNASVELTRAGERFVRVGARAENLKFTFGTPGGVQAGTYAFPEKTFLAIGRDPSALKNFGDLPGSPPEYFRILNPPAGTQIQRGIVPGGEFGGVGGVPEVKFPTGF